MKSNITLFALAIIALTFFACKSNTKETENASKETLETTDTNTSQISLDWNGTYFGTLPCASCPGINTTITLNNDNTYKKTVEYLESKDKPETTKGTFTWHKDGKIISIEENTYLVGENKLFALDADNKVIEGDLAKNYILTKKK